MDDERYCSIEESIIEACREVREMRAGRLPEPSLEEFFKRLDLMIEEERLNENNTNEEVPSGHRALLKKEKVS